MQLLVDIGNTRIKWRWAQGTALHGGGVEAHPDPGREGVLFSRVWRDAGTPSQVVVSNVAGSDLHHGLRNWSVSTWQVEPRFVASARRQCGVSNGYADPGALGVDRWCSLIGAHARVTGPICVVDCGTAITVDLLTAGGEHQGGLISPGFRAMIQALTANARGIQADFTLEPAEAPLGRTTVECIRAGLLAAVAGMVEHTLERLAFPADGSVLLTGGDAALLASALKRPFLVEPELVFYGLATIGAGVEPS